MALAGGQVSVTTSAQSVTTLLGLSAGRRVGAIEVENGGSNTIYEGPSTVTNVPANARGTIPGTAGTRWWSQTFPLNLTISTDEVYLVAATGTTTAFIRLYE